MRDRTYGTIGCFWFVPVEGSKTVELLCDILSRDIGEGRGVGCEALG